MKHSSGKSDIVLGGASGIGIAVEFRFLKESWKVSVIDIQEFEIQDRSEDLRLIYITV